MAISPTTDWHRRVPIVVQASQVPQTLTSIPVCIDETNVPPEIFGGIYEANSDGGDIRFSTDSAGVTEIAREIVSFSLSSNTCQIWVLVPSISSSTNTTVYMWYHNPSATEPSKSATYGAGNTWSGFEGVYHLEEVANNSAGGYKDATNFNHHGTGTSMALARTVQKSNLDYGSDHDGANDYISLPSGIDSPNNTVTGAFSCWVKPDVAGALDGCINFAPSCGILISSFHSSNREITGWWNGDAAEYAADTNLSLSTSTPQYVAFFAFSTGRRAFRNANNFNISGTTTAQSTNSGKIGRERTIAGRTWNGKIDEARINWGSAQGNRMLMEYRTSTDPDTFAIEGTPVYTGPPPGPTYNDMRQNPRGVDRGVGRGVA